VRVVREEEEAASERREVSKHRREEDAETERGKLKASGERRETNENKNGGQGRQ